MILLTLCCLGSFEKIKREINSGWQFKLSNESVSRPATVPSTLTQNLIENKLVDKDLYFRNNFLDMYIYETRDVTYTTTFSVPSRFIGGYARNILVFEGLDTHCDVYLNGAKILTSRNMYVGHRVDVKFKAINNLTLSFNSSANYDIAMQKKFKD